MERTCAFWELSDLSLLQAASPMLVHPRGLDRRRGMSGASTFTGQADKRQLARHRILKGGLLAVAGHHTAIACSVRDLTETGARLKLEDVAALLPDRFELIIEIDGLEAECQVVWRKGSEIGVSFLKTRRGAPRRAQVVRPLQR